MQGEANGDPQGTTGTVWHLPASLLAALLALTIALIGLQLAGAYAQRVASRYVRAVAPLSLRVKTGALTWQRSALADPGLLPIYGTSELYCCAGGYNAPQFFSHAPTGFGVFAVGYPVTGDLFFAQDFAALGGALRGKRVVVSDSWWFFTREGISRRWYDYTFSPEIAAAFAFDSPLPPDLKRAVARRMLDFPESLAGHGLIRLGLEGLAGGSLLDRLGYDALLPLGRLDAWVLRLDGALQTWIWLRQHPELRPEVARHPQTIDWTGVAEETTRGAAALATNNPFGVDDRFFAANRSVYARALARYTGGGSDRLTPVRPQAADDMSHSAGWTDLDLELRVLRALGAEPLVWTVPLAGVYDDYSGVPLAFRDMYYRRYLDAAASAGVPALTFAGHDEDRLFLSHGSHMSARGWTFADLALDRFWHGASTAEIRASLASLAAAVPAPGLPPPPDARGVPATATDGAS